MAVLAGRAPSRRDDHAPPIQAHCPLHAVVIRRTELRPWHALAQLAGVPNRARCHDALIHADSAAAEVACLAVKVGAAPGRDGHTYPILAGGVSSADDAVAFVDAEAVVAGPGGDAVEVVGAGGNSADPSIAVGAPEDSATVDAFILEADFVGFAVGVIGAVVRDGDALVALALGPRGAQDRRAVDDWDANAIRAVAASRAGARPNYAFPIFTDFASRAQSHRAGVNALPSIAETSEPALLVASAVVGGRDAAPTLARVPRLAVDHRAGVHTDIGTAY